MSSDYKMGRREFFEKSFGTAIGFSLGVLGISSSGYADGPVSDIETLGMFNQMYNIVNKKTGKKLKDEIDVNGNGKNDSVLAEVRGDGMMWEGKYEQGERFNITFGLDNDVETKVFGIKKRNEDKFSKVKIQSGINPEVKKYFKVLLEKYGKSEQVISASP